MPPLQIRCLRGDIPETIHDVLIAVVGADGRLLASQGDPDHTTFMRSAAKPFQAVPLFTRGAAEKLSVSTEELALACASHNSECLQVDHVRRFLGRLGFDESDLVCGPHRSLSKDLGYYSPREGIVRVDVEPPSPLASNCSGKHTAMLAVAKHNRWGTSGYAAPDHPVQKGCRRAIAHYCDMDEGKLGMGTDGCGVVTWALPLRHMARGYAHLGVGKGEPMREIAKAMMARPDLVAGQRRLCTALMQAHPNRILAKVGASGVYGAALPERNIGIAIKVTDGNTYAAGTALLALLDQLDLLPGIRAKLPIYAEPVVFNTQGVVVGRYEVVGKITWR